MLQVSGPCGLNGRLLQLLINTWHLKLFIGVFVMFPFRKFLSKIIFFENFDFLSFRGWSRQSVDVHDSLRSIFTPWLSHQYTQPWVISTWEFLFFFLPSRTFTTVYGVFSQPDGPISTPSRGHQYVSLVHEIFYSSRLIRTICLLEFS